MRIYRIVNCHLVYIIYNSIDGTDNVNVLKQKKTGSNADKEYFGSELLFQWNKVLFYFIDLVIEWTAKTDNTVNMTIYCSCFGMKSGTGPMKVFIYEHFRSVVENPSLKCIDKTICRL